MTVTVVPPHGDREETTRIATELLAAADDPQDVRIDTTGSGLVFVVPDEVAKKANVQTPEEPEESEDSEENQTEEQDQDEPGRKRPGRPRKVTQ